jgi:phosphate transport system ATP-binding protein
MTAMTEVAAKTIKVSDLNLYYGKFLAVKDVNVTLQPNKVTALIGSSGCGKSTFLRSLNRMHELVVGAYAEGEVLLDDIDIYAAGTDPVAVRRQVGMVFQAPNPFPTMSIYDNVAAGLKLNSRKIKKDQLDEIVERSLRGANLWEEVKDRLGKPGMSLSGGQQQRLCIARALATEPEVILMDEPASALDPIATTRIEDLMHELKRHYTILIVTHNMQQAARVADMTAFFSVDIAPEGDRTGILVEYDETSKIFTQPSDQRTEDYVTGRFG